MGKNPQTKFLESNQFGSNLVRIGEKWLDSTEELRKKKAKHAKKVDSSEEDEDPLQHKRIWKQRSCSPKHQVDAGSDTWGSLGAVNMRDPMMKYRSIREIIAFLSVYGSYKGRGRRH